MQKLREARNRFLTNIRNPKMRRNVGILFAGKLIGLAIVLVLMNMFIGHPAHAQGDAGGPTPTINALNTVWTLVAAFLVFCMQVGFVMLEAGFARSREAVNILVE